MMRCSGSYVSRHFTGSTGSSSADTYTASRYILAVHAGPGPGLTSWSALPHTATSVLIFRPGVDNSYFGSAVQSPSGKTNRRIDHGGLSLRTSAPLHSSHGPQPIIPGLRLTIGRRTCDPQRFHARSFHRYGSEFGLPTEYPPLYFSGLGPRCRLSEGSSHLPRRRSQDQLRVRHGRGLVWRIPLVPVDL